MEKIMLNNNNRSFLISDKDGTYEFTIHKAILYDDSSFLSHSQSLMLKVFRDGKPVLDKHFSSYPLLDESGSMAEINEKFTGFKELLVEVYEDNPLLSDEWVFNIELEYTAKKPVLS